MDNSKRIKILKIVRLPLLIIVMVICAFVVDDILYETVYRDYIATPKVSLNGYTTESVEVFEGYVDPGLQASIRGKAPKNEIKVEGSVNTDVPGEYYLKYTVQNNSGSYEETLSRRVIVFDYDAPDIELIGDSISYLKTGEEYNEAGANANDNVDGDITNKIEISGEVDSNATGEYNIIYSVADSSDNRTEIKRTVMVQDDIPEEIQEDIPYENPGEISEEPSEEEGNEVLDEEFDKDLDSANSEIKESENDISQNTDSSIKVSTELNRDNKKIDNLAYEFIYDIPKVQASYVALNAMPNWANNVYFVAGIYANPRNAQYKT